MKKLFFKMIELNDKEYYFLDVYVLDFKEVKG